MITETDTIDKALRLDGNAIAGELQMMLGLDATLLQALCSHCHQEGVFASLLAYVRGPGVVLRCPSCEGVVLQLVKTPSGTVITLEGSVAGVSNTILRCTA